MSILAKQLIDGDRTALARAITLVESTRDDHQNEAGALLAELLPKTGASVRLGITGVPGVGKSTFIEAFGLHLIEAGHRVAVLAIDPSSAKTGGSILGDKTRMARLSQHEHAYIRPSPASGVLGGVARRTREAMLLCEAAGYDVVIVETVGVGQSETEVADMVDMFLLLLLPGSGDDLQGIKKGIVELADLIIINKADGDLLAQAKRVSADYASAVKMLHTKEQLWVPKVMICSALQGAGIAETWSTVSDFFQTMQRNGEISRRRGEQSIAWMWKEVHETLISRFMHHPGMNTLIQEMEVRVQKGTITAAAAAQSLIYTYAK